MKRFNLWTLGGLAASGLCVVAACDSDDDGGNGGGGATTTATGSDCSCYACADYIAECINECPAGDPEEVLCADALPVLNQVNLCICDAARGDCRDVCAGTCAISDSLFGGGGPGGAGQGGAPPEDTAQCIPCQSEAVASDGPCAQEWNACMASDDCS